MATNERHLWNGRPVIHPQHSAGLEQAAAVNEFQHGMPRQEAEHKAYAEYRKTQHLEAAAFHLRGLKSSQGSGDLEEAKKHGAMYQLHAEKLGFEPWKEPPPELKVHLENAAKEQVHRFKAHRGDQFVLDDHKVQANEPIAKSLHKLYIKASAALEKLQKGWPKDETENNINANAHAVVEDSMYDQGAVKKPFNGTKALRAKGNKILGDGARPYQAEPADTALRAPHRINFATPDVRSKSRYIADNDSSSQATVADHEFWHALGRAVGVNANKTCSNCGAAHDGVSRTIDPAERNVNGENVPTDLCDDCYTEKEGEGYEDDSQHD